MSVKDVNTKAAQLDAKLSGKLFLGGNTPSAEDAKAFQDLLGDNLNVLRWVKNMASYSEAERKGWGAPVKVTAPPLKPVEEPKKKEEPTKKEEPKKAAAAPAAAAAADDDDVDLFGETTEEEKAALEAKKAKDADKKKEKKAVIAKSSILFDIKVWDETIDLEALAQKIKSVHKDGLVWGEHKLIPVAFGMKKLQLLIVIEDDKVSGDDLEEMIMGYEDEVQSMDIVAWNKI